MYILPKKIYKINIIFISIISAIIAGVASRASATFEQLAVSPKALSLGNAVTAYPMGVMSIHYNPASLSYLKDNERSIGFTYMPIMKKQSKFDQSPEYPGLVTEAVDPVAGSSGTTTSGAVRYPLSGVKNFMGFPNLGISHRTYGSKWTFAFGMYAPYAGGFNHGHSNDPARFGGERAYNQRFVYAAPGLAFQVSDTLSIGFSICLGQSSRGLNQSFRAPNDITAITDIIGQATEGLNIPVLTDLTLPGPWLGGGLPTYGAFADFEMELIDDLDTSYNIGMSWEPFKWLAFGACYQSEAKSKPYGKYTFKYSERFQNFVRWFTLSPVTVMIGSTLNMLMVSTPYQSGTVTLKKAIHPQRSQFGVMFRPFERLRLMCDLNWTNWSAIDKEVYTFDQDIQLLQATTFLGYSLGRRTYVVKRDLKDIWHTSYGLEVKPFHWMSLRAGYEERKSYINDDRLFDLTLPIQDMDIYTFGLGLELNPAWSVDLACAYMKSDTYKIRYKDGILMSSADFFDVNHNPYPGMDYEQKTKAVLFSFGINYAW